jgi:hypothetical protein
MRCSHGRRSRTPAVRSVVCAAALVLTACGSASAPSASGTSPARASAVASTSPRPACPNGDGGTCLGVLKAGTYSTFRFRPRLTYTVPGGWANFEDNVGNFSLAPPGVSLAKASHAIDDIFVMTIVQAAAMGCEGAAETDVPDTARGIAMWLTNHPDLVTTGPRPVRIGGLKGYSLSVRMTSTGGIRCGGPLRSVPIFMGYGDSQGDFWLGGPSDRAEVYLLNFEGFPLGIVADSSGEHGPSLTADAKVIAGFRFAKR